MNYEVVQKGAVMIIESAVFQNEQELRSILYSDLEMGGQKVVDGFIGFITEYPVTIKDFVVMEGVPHTGSVSYAKPD